MSHLEAEERSDLHYSWAAESNFSRKNSETLFSCFSRSSSHFIAESRMIANSASSLKIAGKLEQQEGPDYFDSLVSAIGMERKSDVLSAIK
jgi:hypothetical protein